MTSFEPFPKMARLSRECVITEKIDGTNAQLFIYDPLQQPELAGEEGFTSARHSDGTVLNIRAGSRTRWIVPGNDNFGFAKWVWEHADELVLLGPGRHFGEWWGSGIQRGYGLPKGEKRFSLFNTSRWCLHGTVPRRIETADPRVEKYQEVLPACVGLVPELFRGEFTTVRVDLSLSLLSLHGSQAAPGFMGPEGIVCFHTAANVGFKKTLKNDEAPKSKQS